MTTEDTFSSHPLLLALAEDMQPMTRKAARKLIARTRRTKSWPRKKKTPAKLPQPFSYYYGVFYHVTSLTSAVDNLDRILIFMRSFPNKRTYERNKITRASWIKYHYANFISTLVSLFDISLIITNHVFQLGIPDSKSTHHRVLGNKLVLATTVASRLQRLQRLGSKFRTARNLHLHRGQPPDIDQLEELDPISFLQLNYPEPVIDARDLSRLFKLATKGITQELRKVSATNRTAVKRFLDALWPHYQARKKVLLAGTRQ